jgi:hypothetical protein
MTVEQREKIQRAIQALIDVESALREPGGLQKPEFVAIEAKLRDARLSLVELNAPDYT